MEAIKYMTGVRGITATVFVEETKDAEGNTKTKKNLAYQFSVKEENLPENNNGYFNFRLYPSQIDKLKEAQDQICEEHDIKTIGGSVRRID